MHLYLYLYLKQNLSCTIKCSKRTSAVFFIGVVEPSVAGVMTVILVIAHAALGNASSVVALHPVRETPALLLQPAIVHVTALIRSIHYSQ